MRSQESRSRLTAALNHQEGPIPVDFGGTTVTGIHISIVEALRQHYGLDPSPVKVLEPFQMLGEVCDDLRTAMGVDVSGLMGRKSRFGYENKDWVEFRLPWGQVALVPEGFRTTPDGSGGLLIYPEGDLSAAPSGRMPDGGFFFDAIVRQQPIVEDLLDPEDNLEEFGAVAEADLNHYQLQLEALAPTGRGLIANFGGTGLGDIASVPAPFLRNPKGIRDIAEWYISTASRRDYIHAIFARQTEIALGNLELFHSIVGDAIDAVFICGTDFGTQTGTFCSPATFRELYAPYYRLVTGWIHANTAWKTFKHSCGSVVGFIPDFIDVGFDILNPVQCSAAGMTPEILKARFGSNIVFWGGAVDTQHTLPFGTPADVRLEVLERCRIFGGAGGYVAAAVHNVQAKTPLANVVAMVDAFREYNVGR